MNDSFIFKNLSFHYITNVLNTNRNRTERIIELPLMHYFLDTYHNEDIAEVGCVSPYYRNTDHKVYDLTDNHYKCIRENACKLILKNKYVLSISTIEHFDTHDYGVCKDSFLNPYEWLLETIKISKKYLITYPLGYNKKLDAKILTSNITMDFLSRVPMTFNWIEKNKANLTDHDFTYDFSFDTCANSVCIIQNIL